MTVNICGIPHKIVECEDNFNVDTHFGQIDYYEGVVTFQLGTIATMLADISKSLAIIADKAESEGKDADSN